MKDLKNKLEAWRVEVDLPPRFQAGVWQRIADRAPRRAGIFDSLKALLLRPAWSVALVAAAVAFGLGGAHFAAARTRAGAMRDMQAQYVRMIDPFVPGS